MNNSFDLSGRVAIVTGASRGLGQQMARALARAGADLVVTSRDVARLADFVGEVEALGRRALPVKLDVRSEDDIEGMVRSAVEAYGRLDILVNNAGLNIRKPVAEFTWDEYDTVLETNLKGAFFCARAAARAMAERQYGRIINIGSCTCAFGMHGIVPYTASRGGTLQMTRGMAVEWGRSGINVNCLAPGWFRTAQTRALYENREWLDYLMDRIPLGRPGQPGDLDGAVVFLASEASAYITGQVLFVDGGFTTGATRAIVNGPSQDGRRR